jgi:hypothetical protein
MPSRWQGYRKGLPTCQWFVSTSVGCVEVTEPFMLRNKPLPGQSAVVCVCVCRQLRYVWAARLVFCGSRLCLALFWLLDEWASDSSTGVGQSTEFRSHQITLHFYVAVDIHLSLWTGCKERRNPITGFVVSVPCVWWLKSSGMLRRV